MFRTLYKSILKWQPKNKPISPYEKSKSEILEDSQKTLRELGLLSPKMEEDFRKMNEKTLGNTCLSMIKKRK